MFFDIEKYEKYEKYQDSTLGRKVVTTPRVGKVMCVFYEGSVRCREMIGHKTNIFFSEMTWSELFDALRRYLDFLKKKKIFLRYS